ncbi:MAG: thioredoxin family protein, partial [Planctomycetota bacterium]
MVRSMTLLAVAYLSLCAVSATFADEAMLLNFTSPNCGPCRQMKGAIRQLAAAGYRVEVVDVSRDPQTAQRFGVNSWPTFVVLADGRERARISGIVSYNRLAALLEKASTATQTAAASRARIEPIGSPFAGRSSAGPPQTFLNAPPSEPRLPPARLDRPQPGRILDIQGDVGPSQASRSVSPVGPPATRSAPSSTPAGSAGMEPLLASSVRIAVTDPDGKSSGAGTLVDARRGEALVLTCGHIFRSSRGEGA